MNATTRLPLPDSPAAQAALQIVRRLRSAGHAAYWVGGCVRDLLLGRAPHDFDVATSAHPPEVRRLFDHIVEVGAAFGVLRVHVRDDAGRVHEVEVATFRAEAGYSDGRRPDEVRFTDAREDVLRRDFTINGLLCDPLDTLDGRAAVVDWVGGIADLHARRLRAIGLATERFAEDALRLLRAPRFAARFGLSLEPQTALAIVELAPTLARVSAERVREELQHMLTAPSAGHAMRLMGHLELGPVLWPELAAIEGAHSAAAERLERWHAARLLPLTPAPDGHPLDAGADLAVGLAVVLAPVQSAWPAARLAERFRLARQEVQRVLDTWRLARALPDPLPAPEEVRQTPALIRLLREPTADAALLLRTSYLPADGATPALRLRQLRAATPRAAWSPAPWVTGDTLRALGHPPGPRFRDALLAAEDAQLLDATPEVVHAAALAALRDAAG